jgi:diguanylate cyclase (GGDEF)-like protein/PAS domain S-box-containing protein
VTAAFRIGDIEVSERFLQALLPMGVVALDGELLLANAALSALVTTPPDALAGRSLAELCGTPENREAVAGMLGTASSGSAGGQLTLTLTATDRDPVPVRATWTVMCDAAGAPWYLTVICVDETERVQAEQRLAASERRWRALLRHTGDLTWTFDSDGVVTWMTPGAIAQLGFSCEEIIGTTSGDLLHPEDRDAVLQRWDDVLQRRSPQSAAEYRLVRADGSVLWVRGTVTDLREDPDVGALLGNAVDVTETRRESEARRRADAGLRARFDQSRVPQGVVDRDGHMSELNDAFCALLGRTRQDLLGRCVSEIRHPDEEPGAGSVLARAASGQAPRAHGERLLQRADGTAVPVFVDATALYDADGRGAGAACLLYDLTALREAERRRQRQEEFHAALDLRASDPAFVTDAEGVIVFASAGVSHVFGYAVEDVVGCGGWTFVHPDDLGLALARFRQVVAEGGSTTFSVRVRDAGGEWRWIEDTVSNLLHTGVGGMVCNLRDITEQVRAEQALRDSEARYRAIADTAEEGIWVVSPDNRTVYANARMAAVLGQPLQQLYDRWPTELLDPDGRHGIAARMRTRHRTGAERYEMGYRHPDGSERRLWVAASPLRTADGVLEGSLAMISDVTEARRNERELQHSALHDALTGLPNRALLQDRLEQALSRPGRTTAVLSLDLDQFKVVNDSRGHDRGDQLLRDVAHRLRTAARPHDTVARFSGDEFVVVCQDVDQERAERIGADLLQALGQPFEVDGAPVHISASIGIALSPAASGSDLLRYADMAMYSAKEAGRSRVRLFDRGLAEEAEQHYALAADLRVALAEGALALHYQPVIDLQTGRVAGIEALSRWQHPQLGAVAPNRFIAVAERGGLIQQLDRWALQRALSDAGELRRSGVLPPDAYVAVNLSAHNVGDGDLEHLIAGWAQEAGLPPEQVVLEITETAIMHDTATAIPLLHTLRARGFGIAVDDFGTGYSSLAYLRDLPVTSLKIDRSFVSDITCDADARSIVASIVELARAVGVLPVAEGVETTEQAAVLRRLGCSLGQGWLWSPAVPADEVRRTRAWTTGYDVPPCGDLRVSGDDADRRRPREEGAGPAAVTPATRG